jgi:hypothetical protein
MLSDAPIGRLLVLDGPLFGRVHFLSALALQEYGLDLFVEERFCLRVPRIKPVMIDQQGLVLQPIAPTILADLSMYPLSQLVLERGFLEFWGVVSAAMADDGIHRNPGVGGEMKKLRERVNLQDPPVP